MTEFIATIRLIGTMVFLWKKLRGMIVRGEADLWMQLLERTVDDVEAADTAEKKQKTARDLVGLLNRIR